MVVLLEPGLEREAKVRHWGGLDWRWPSYLEKRNEKRFMVIYVWMEGE